IPNRKRKLILNRIADECLEPFDDGLKRACDGGKWQPRYFYDRYDRECKLFWYDGCPSTSRNNFDDPASCKWKCEGKHSNPRSRSCMDVFDTAYLKKCWSGPYEKRYFFNHEKKQCELFYYGGCMSTSKNIFLSYDECEDLCETPSYELFTLKFIISIYKCIKFDSTKINDICFIFFPGACYQPFDFKYEESCSSDGSYKIQYYYDQNAKQCRMFWFGNCKRDSENIFPTLATCQWICERRILNDIPKKCIDKFDRHYADSCGQSVWKEKWYFDHALGLCTPFWHDGCTSDSQNIFDDLETCLWLCEKPGELRTPDDKYKCVEDKSVGDCDEKYPAFFYNKDTQRCEPFAYSGCGGNNNRFLTVQQCESTCGNFKYLSEPEFGCHLPLATGHGKNERGCQQFAGFRYYYNKHYERCGKFWYFGCGGNSNRFSSYSLCERICQRTITVLTETKQKEPSVCFLPTDFGMCLEGVSNGSVRWSYDSVSKHCRSFNYSGCGGNENRFATEQGCNKLCRGLIKPLSNQCAHYPDWGPCNQLRYMWFYNMSSGACEEFLYGGCDGNPNRFSTFKDCQRKSRNVTLPATTDVCLEPMDRGRGCPNTLHLETRWYYDVATNSCIGYHSEGCGTSGNDFKSERQCKEKLVKILKISLVLLDWIRSPEQTPMKMHQVLVGDKKSYFKTKSQWVHYGQCLGYSNKKFIPLLKNQQVKAYTNKEEKCEVLRPWLKGLHLYSSFFTVQRKPLTATSGHHRVQYPNETIASLIVFPLNDCRRIC
ncbi:unnamed protein product, partial [Enterobius vermicularis]|uniref:Kunitz/Bovine pancreatic trypsin inhibitor domain protein n=1 Tax=Enterobius vermicularis TaxID=51028 RepID=A0A0N4V160_ENTVE